MKITDLNMPAWMRKMDSVSVDPVDSVPYGYETPNAGCFVLARAVPLEHSLVSAGKQAIIDGLHRTLHDDQGLIEVEEGKTAAGRRYLYSVVKTLKQPSGVQYTLILDLDDADCSVTVHGTFDEKGTTGFRDSMVFAMLSNGGKVEVTEDGIKGWNADPYDPEYLKGSLMNCSETREYDTVFPLHPLSVLRQFVTELVELN